MLRRGCRLVYLSPYSPDYNPIEEAFSAMKAWIRANRDYVLGEMTGELTCNPFVLLTRAVFATDPGKHQGLVQGFGIPCIGVACIYMCHILQFMTRSGKQTIRVRCIPSGGHTSDRGTQ